MRTPAQQAATARWAEACKRNRLLRPPKPPKPPLTEAQAYQSGFARGAEMARRTFERGERTKEENPWFRGWEAGFSETMAILVQGADQ